MGFDDVAKRMQARNGGGMSPPGATPEQMQADAFKAERQAQARNDIVFGGILLVIGIGITAVTHDHASREGGTYVVAYGPIVVGFIKLMRGFMRLGG